MPKISRFAAALAIIPALAACSPEQARDAIASSAASSASSNSSDTTTSTGSSVTLREARTTKVMIDDMNLSEKQCSLTFKNAAKGYVLPDKACTPGAIDTAVTQANIDSTICQSGYTTTVRPSNSTMKPYFNRSYGHYGISTAAYPKKYTEYDHLVSLQLGGASTVSNLFPEPNKAGARGKVNPKDAVENALRSAVCHKAVTLRSAQEAIASDWTTALVRLDLHAKVVNGRSSLCKSDGSCIPSRWNASDDDD